MFTGFSSGLKLTDLNDFITPSQECIKPVKIEGKKDIKGKGVIEIEDSQSEVDSSKFEKAKITLNDCLACSGCITSAEVVLVNQQSLKQFCRILDDNEQASQTDKLIIVLSLSVQSVLSIAARYKLSPQEASEKIIGYFKSLGVHYAFDVSFARCFSIIESQKEFVSRFKRRDEASALPLPLLASSCPGWVCYAEKTHGSYVLPYISKVRSPQHVMGSILKDYWAKKLSVAPYKIYHATLMPCFDKKLEASREEFYIDEHGTKEVDCVITSVEVEQLLENEGIRLDSVVGVPLDPAFSIGQNLYTHEGSGSGGFAHHVLCYAAKTLFGIEETTMNWKTLRNSDMRELNLEKNGEVVLKFAIVNGFRNIQNLVQKLKRKKSPYHYVEVMACPSGCLNGGAQIRPESGISSKELVGKLENFYTNLPKVPRELEDRINDLYSEWIGKHEDEEFRHQLHTTYKEIETNVNPLGIKW